MRVLFLTRLFYPHIGGVEKHVFEISKVLRSQGHSVIVVTELFDSKLKHTEKYQGIQILRIPVGKSDWLKKFVVWRYLWEHRELFDQTDVIHAHDVFFWMLPFRLLFFKKVFTTFHGYESFPLKEKNIWVHRISAKLSHKTISVGKFLDKWYGIKSSKIVYGAVDPMTIKQKVNPNSAIFIGRLDEQTGIEMYYNAFKLIHKKIPQFRMTVVGNGIFRKNIKSPVRVIGAKKNPYIFFNTHRFAFVSRYLSIYEAFAAQKLVFAVYDNPLKKDYLAETPFANLMIIAENAEDLAQKVMTIVKKPLKEKQLTAKAYNFVTKHTWKHMTEEYLDLWRKKESIQKA